MKITDIRHEMLRVKLEKPFVVAIGAMEYAETIIVKVTTDEGITGYGEASPFSPVTGETIESVPSFLELFKKALIGQNPFELEKIHKIMNNITVGNSSAKAGIDIAVHDIIGKRLNMPLYKVLGGYRDSFRTDMTVGLAPLDEMVQDAVLYAQMGFGILKIKAGLNPDDDIKVIKMIREAVGESIRLRVDANQGWSVKDSIRVIDVYMQYGVEAVEQPVRYWNIDGLAYIRNNTRLPIMADESLHSPEDAIKLAKSNAVDIFNIKLMKSGGLYPALRINAIGESSGIPCMLGCMLETRVSITAAASLVAAQKNITEADLDSDRHFGDMISGGFSIEKGLITMLDKPGLGVELNF